MNNNGQGSWKCGGCSTWYAYWVFKCECEKANAEQEETAVAGAPTTYYFRAPSPEELQEGLAKHLAVSMHQQFKVDVLNAITEVLESA